MSTYDNASELDFFRESLNSLIKELLHDDLEVSTGRWFESNLVNKIQKSAWVASLLASSDDESHQSQALSFAILSYIKYQNTEYEEVYERYLYIVLSRVGNLQSFNTVRREDAEVSFEEELISSLDSALSLELSADIEEHELDDGTFISSFQKDILDALTSGKDVAISGPTSSGKSFILRKYIEKKVDQGEEFEAIYVVPTKALISEVSEKLANLHDDIAVQTGAYFGDEEIDENEANHTFLVVTPERCLRLIDQDTRSKIDPQLIFFDEIQNVQDGERGVLFENIIQLLSGSWSDTQIVAAGPYLKNPSATLSQLSEREVVEIKTAFIPILQMKAILRFKKSENQNSHHRRVDVILYSPTGDKLNFTIPEPDDLTYTTVKSSKQQTLTVLLDEYGKDSQNLVYAGKTNHAENRAGLIAADREQRVTSPRIDELRSFLKNAIHEDYPLIDYLEKGVAFHHGRVPKIAKEEIEELYRDKDGLDTIVCTSTLLEGVNLPAEKIFLTSAYRGDEKLSELDFQNLVGRVGRVDSKLYGAIYCIEAEDEDWVDERLEGDAEETVEPATSKATNKPNELITALGQDNLRQIDDSSIRYTSVLLRSRYLKSDYDVRKYLDSKNVSDSDIDSIESELHQSLKEVDIPERLLRRNPTVDPLEQDQLYKRVKKNPEQWIVANNWGDYSYGRFLQVTRQLNQVFKFTKDSQYNINPANRETEHGAIMPIVVVANQWLQGKPYRSMIESRRDSDKVPAEKIGKSIREVLKLVNDDVRFVLFKYYGMLVDILKESDHELSRWARNFDQMLEMGSMKFGELRLMAQGVDRSVALELGIPPDVDDVHDYLQDRKGKLSPFYVRHLESQGVL